MILVISSPSSSTTGFCTFILAIDQTFEEGGARGKEMRSWRSWHPASPGWTSECVGTGLRSGKGLFH
jgi:hypothetical protein